MIVNNGVILQDHAPAAIRLSVHRGIRKDYIRARIIDKSAVQYRITDLNIVCSRIDQHASFGISIEHAVIKIDVLIRIVVIVCLNIDSKLWIGTICISEDTILHSNIIGRNDRQVIPTVSGEFAVLNGDAVTSGVRSPIMIRAKIDTVSPAVVDLHSINHHVAAVKNADAIPPFSFCPLMIVPVSIELATGDADVIQSLQGKNAVSTLTVGNSNQSCIAFKDNLDVAAEIDFSNRIDTISAIRNIQRIMLR